MQPFGTFTISMNESSEFEDNELEVANLLKMYNRDRSNEAVKPFDEIDLIANTLYIYLMLIFSYIALGVILYGIREYCLSFRDKGESVLEKEVDKLWNSNQSDTHNEDKDLEDMGSYNRQDETIAESMPLGVNRINIEDKDRSILMTPEERESQLLQDIEEFKKIQVIHDEINSGCTFKDMSSSKPNTSGKVVYKYAELFEMEPSSHYELEVKNENKLVRVSEILQYSCSIPQVDIDDGYQVNKLIRDIKGDILDNKGVDITTKSVQLFRLITLSLAMAFLNGFNELIEFSIDTGILTNTIEAMLSDNMKILTIEMVLNYCWSHWNYEECITNNRLYISEPIIQNKITIIRILFNLKLGTSNIENLSPKLQKLTEFKLQVMIRHIMREISCNQYLDIIPMIYQGVVINDNIYNRSMFYDILMILIKGHSHCCMTVYLGENYSELKLLVQHGLWYKQDKKIITKSKEILNYLKNQYSWIDWDGDINNGKKFIPLSSDMFPYGKRTLLTAITPGDSSTVTTSITPSSGVLRPQGSRCVNMNYSRDLDSSSDTTHNIGNSPGKL